MTHLWFSHHIISKGLATNMIYHWRICYWHDWSNVCQVSLLWSCLSHHFSYCALWKEFIVYCSYWKGGEFNSTFWRGVFSLGNMPFHFIYLLHNLFISVWAHGYLFLFFGVQPKWCIIYFVSIFSSFIHWELFYLVSMTHSYMHKPSFIF